jgi:hypothetical protein
VVLDFLRVDEFDKGGAGAVEALVQSIRASGTHVRIAHPARGTRSQRFISSASANSKTSESFSFLVTVTEDGGRQRISRIESFYSDQAAFDRFFSVER